METAFGDFRKLTDAFVAAAVDSTRWECRGRGHKQCRRPSAPSRPGSLRYSEPVPRTNSGGLRPDRWVERDERHRSLRALLRRAWLATSTSPRPSRSREIRSTRDLFRSDGRRGPTDFSWCF